MARTARIVKKEELVESDYEIGGKLTRTIVMAGVDGKGKITITELDEDTNVVTIQGGNPGVSGSVSIDLDAERLWNLAGAVALLSGGELLCHDEARAARAQLIDKVRDVLCANESRCLDDDIDREVVLNELVKALTGS